MVDMVLFCVWSEKTIPLAITNVKRSQLFSPRIALKEAYSVLSCEFRWMHGSFLDLNGDSIEQEVEELLREIYKMLKSFQQKQKKAEQDREKIKGVKRRSKEEEEEKQENATILICSSVLDQVKEFKVGFKLILFYCAKEIFSDQIPPFSSNIALQECIPLVSILCNPGIRPRHWEQMSEVVGYDLTPDSGTTLQKVLKQNLSSYLELFESISVGASKVRTLWF